MYLVAQGFYLSTLAPTVLWGDDARLQRQAAVLDLTAERAWDHPFWVLTAHPFTRIPVGDQAFRVNLFSSICAAIGIALVFGCIRTLAGSIRAGAVGAASLMVSHTFWTHAVRTEVYSLNMALLSLSILCLVQPRLNWRYLLIAALASAAAVINHVMMLLVLPGLAVLVLWRVRGEGLGLKHLVPATVGFFAPIGIYRILVPFERMVSMSPGEYMPSAGDLGAAMVVLGAYLVLQFPSPGLLFLPWGIRRSLTKRPFAVALVLIFLANLAAVLNFKVRDAYVFYMLTYFVCAFWIGLGSGPVADWLHRRTGLAAGRVYAALLAGVIILPVVAYSLMPGILRKAGITGADLNIREIEGRPSLEFFLFPPKKNHFGARLFAEGALGAVPPNSVIIADHTLRQPMRYLQKVEGFRADVDVVEIVAEEQVEFAVSASRTRPVFLAETEPYYDVAGLSEHFTIEPEGMIYRLRPLEGREGG